MHIELHNDTDLTITRLDESALTVNVGDGHYGGLQMLIVSLASCTYSTLASYAQRVEAGTEKMCFRMKWKFAEKPKRISSIDMDILWPELAEDRLDAAQRAAHMCTVHNTLKDSVEIESFVHN